MQENLTIALLIDADNVSSKYMSKVERELIALGNVTYKRIYGDFTEENSRGWKTLVHDYALQPIQQYSYVKGKNATDSRLIIDAMDILYSDTVNAVCIMSSDSDYTTLAKRLKESNIYVIGAGEEKTLQCFVKACDRFIILNEKTEEEKKAVKKKTKEVRVADTSKAETPKGKRNAKQKETELRDEPQTVSVVKKSEVEKFVVELLRSQGDGCALEWVMTKILQRFSQFDFKDYHVKKSYQFFDEKKFELKQLNHTSWTISLK